MLFVRIINYLRGYVVVCADSFFLERFLNICLRRSLLLWDIKKTGERRMTAKMSIRAFREIRPVARRTRTRLHILQRCGLPFLLHRYRKRKLALFGLALFVALLWYTSSHVMSITIYGNNRIATETIRTTLADYGVSPGAPLSALDQKYLQNQLTAALDDIAWVGINRSGSRIYVEVVERLEQDPKVDQETPCNLVAEKDGVIAKIEARQGQTMVKVGDGVRAGDVLVSGIMDNSATGFRYVHAFGDVYATTIYQQSGEYPLAYQEKLYTGNETARYGISILGQDIPFFFNKRQPYATCEQAEEVTEYNPPVDILPPVYLKRTVYKEQQLVDRTRTEDEAVRLGTEELSRQIEDALPDDAEIRDRKVSHILTEFNTVLVTVEITCRENIASENIIDKNALVDYDKDGGSKNTPSGDSVQESDTNENSR